MIDYLRRFRGTGLPWPVPPDLDEAAVEARLFATDAVPVRGRAVPDWATIHAELKQKGVTLQLLWIEYKRQTPDGYKCTYFCQHYRIWADTLEPALRQVHVAGEKTVVDYAGLTMPVHDVATDTVREAQIFVGALGFCEHSLTVGSRKALRFHADCIHDRRGHDLAKTALSNTRELCGTIANPRRTYRTTFCTSSEDIAHQSATP